MTRMRASLAALVVLAAVLAAPAAAQAQIPGLPPIPILEDPQPPAGTAQFTGSPAVAKPVSAPEVPRHPFMAPNGFSNIHADAYQTDTYGWGGPLGRDIQTSSTLFFRECPSPSLDSDGHLAVICVGLDHAVATLLDPVTLEVLATYDLPPRNVSANPFRDFSGGGYFYLDNQDRIVTPTPTRHVFVIAQTGGPGLELERDYDLSGVVAQGDGIISALPDWDGRIWFASVRGVVGWIDPATGQVTSRSLGEGITNSFAVDDTGGVFIVTDRALYRLDARKGNVDETWRVGYDNNGVAKPGQSDAGSGTTPTLLGRNYVAIADNADPMQIVVVRRRADLKADRRKGKRVRGQRHRIVCEHPVFAPGQGSTDQSLIGAGKAMVVENNYGYTGPFSTMNGDTTLPGFERVDIRKRGRGCRTIWHNDETAPSLVPKLSLANGLVYTYTKPPRDDDADVWYLTAIDFHTGETVWRSFAGEGLGFNNNFAPVTLAPDGTAYVGVLGGLARFADGS
jgi:hypothetical protein